MASQITHIVYGKKIFDRHPGFEWRKFAMGTIFPDIRYITNLGRDVTHVYDTFEEKIPDDNSFEAGRYVHCYVDEKREAYIQTRNIYSLFPESKFVAPSLKIYEDALTYDLYDKWDEMGKLFGNILEEPKHYGVTDDKQREWYNFMAHYFAKKPDESTWRKFIQFLDYPLEVENNVIETIQMIAAEPRAVKIIKDTYNII